MLPKFTTLSVPTMARLTLATLLSAALVAGFSDLARSDDNADASVTACSSSITSCGCTVTKSGVYLVNADLDATQGLTGLSDCIDIRAKNVIINFQMNAVTGPGINNSTGAGIRVLKKAKGTFIEGDNTNVTAWNIGMQIDASNVITDWVQTRNNGQAGTFLNNTKNVNVNDFSTTGNSTFGVWIRGGSNNQINCSSTDDNGKIGLYIGCHDDGSHGTKCKGFKGSKNNRIFGHSTDINGDIGIVIDLGNTGNVVGDFDASRNGGSFDSVDENPNCDGNVWLAGGASYNRTNQGCIPGSSTARGASGVDPLVRQIER